MTLLEKNQNTHILYSNFVNFCYEASPWRSTFRSQKMQALFSHSIWSMKFLLQFIITAAIIYVIAEYQYVPGIVISHWYASALVFAVILSLVNLILWTILRFIAFPLRILTLGLFSFVISIIVVKVTAELVPSVTLSGIVPLIVVALVMSVTSFILRVID